MHTPLSRSFKTSNPHVLLFLAPLALVALTQSAAQAQLALGLGGTSGDEGRAVAVDAVGNTYITGFFNGTVDFDPGPGTFELTATGGSEATYVASYDPAGALRYALSFRGEGRGIAVDGDGNVFATGETGSGGVDVDPDPDGELILDWLEGRVYVVSYDPAGNLRFGFTVGGAIVNRIEGGQAIDLDAAGNLYITGIVNDETDFDPTTGETIVPFEGITDSFLASYTNDGGIRFAIGIGGSLSDAGLGLTVDATGNSYLTGTFRDTVDFDPGPDLERRVSHGNRDLYLASYTADGEFRFAFGVGGSAEDVGNAVAVDADGNSFVTGSFQAQADFDPGPGTETLTSDGGDDFFLASYTNSGDLRFAFPVGNPNAISGFGIAVDDLGRPHVTGGFTNFADFDPGPGEQILDGAEDAFVAGYSSSGEFRYAYNYQDIGLEYGDSGQGIALDAAGLTYVTGAFGGTSDFDPGPDDLPLTSNGYNDVFLVRSAPHLSGVQPGTSTLAAFTMSRAYPNPTAGRWQFRLDMLETSHIRVGVYDIAGRLVSELHNGFLHAGDSRNLEFGSRDLPSGIYFVRVSDPAGVKTDKVLVVR